MVNIRNYMDKKGVAISTLIVIIIVVVGFAILLFFYSQVAWTGNIDRTICHQSVVYRATLPGFANAKELVPLKCRTEKVCITTSRFGKCDEFEGSNDARVKVVKNLEELEQFIAKDTLSCWETMGRGELSLFAGGVLLDEFGLGDTKSSCVICSRIAFDNENLLKKDINKEDMDIFKYMVTHKAPGEEISYYEKVLGNTGRLSLNDANRGSNNVDKVLASNTNPVSKEDEFIPSAQDSDEMAILFMQVTSVKWRDVFISDLTLLGVGAIGGKTSGRFIPKFISGSKIGAGAAKVGKRFLLVAAIAGLAFQTYSVYESKGVTASYCGDVKVGDEAQEGCSVVRTMNYNVNDIAQFCGKIESIS